MCSRTADFQAACIKHMEEKDQRVVRVIGKRLYIDGYIYARSYLHRNGKIHWQCRRLHKGLCHARAITSDPTVSGNIILYRGLKESKHNHSPSLAEREEAEEQERSLDIEKKEFKLPSTNHTHENQETGSNNETTSESESEESKSTETVENMTRDGNVVSKTNSKGSACSSAVHDIDPNHGLYTAPKLISKKLHIDGYTYTRNGLSSGSKLYWMCRRTRKYKCQAKATTSNPLKGQKLKVHKGPNESSHSHPPIPADVEKDERAAKCHWRRRKFESDINCKSEKQTTEESDPAIAEFLKDFEDAHSSGGTHTVEKKTTIKSIGLSDETSSKIEPKTHELSIRAEKVRVDGRVAGAKLKLDRTSKPKRTRKSCYIVGLDYSQGPMPARLIDSKNLQINGFTYFRTGLNNDSSRYYWTCKRYQQTEKCSARAVTSGPCPDQELIVYKGPNESEHNHRAPLANAEKSEEEVPGPSGSSQKESKSNEYDPIVDRAVVDCISKPNQSQKDQKIDNRNERDSSTDQKNSATDSLLPRLIGPRLCMAGYIYIRNKTHTDGKITWECRKCRSQGCRARAVTSNPLVTKTLILYKGVEESKHDHPPSERDVEESKLFAKFGKKWVSEALNCNINLPSITETTKAGDLRKNIKTNESGLQAGPSTPHQVPSDGGSLEESSPRLIGKRLFIDGYIYIGKNYYDTCISWECRRQSLPTGKCSAKAITSNPLKDGALVVYDGPDVYKHNHSPSLAEVEEAKEYATLGLRKVKPNAQIDPQTSSVTHDLEKTRMIPRQCKSNIERLSFDGSESESESECSTPSKKRRKISATRRQGAAKRQAHLSDPFTYRSFLTRFLKHPTFDRKHVFQALRSIYKSDTGCIIGYAMVLENREKIERDLEVLKSNPNVETANLSGIRPIINSEDIESDNNVSEKKRQERINTADPSSTSDYKTSFEKSHEGETPQTPSTSFHKQAVSPKVPKLKKRVTFDKNTSINEKLVNANPEQVPSLSSPSKCENQILSNPSVSIIDSEDEVDVGQEIDGVLYLPGTTCDKDHSRSGRPNQMVPVSNITDSEDEVDVGQEIDGILYLPGESGDKAYSQSARPISTNESCENEMVHSSNLSEVNSTHSIKIEEKTPAPVSIKDLLVPGTSSGTMDLNQYVFTLKEEVPTIDLTDGCDTNYVKQECTSDEAHMHQMPMQELICSGTNNSIETSVLESRQTSKSVLPNPLCPANFVVHGMQTQTQNQFISPNMHGVRIDANPQYNQHPGSSRLVHTPYLVGDLQVPLLINVPSTSDNGALHTDQLYAQIQVFRQPSSYNYINGPKS